MFFYLSLERLCHCIIIFVSLIFYFYAVSEGEKTLKEFSISDVGPEEVTMEKPKNAHWLECTIPHLSDLYEIKIKISAINHRWTKATIKKAADPFAQGEQRITFHGERIYGEKHDRRNDSIVLKEFKHSGTGRDRREDYIEIMETQAVAAFLATEFNMIAPKGSKEIQFLHIRKCLLIYMESVWFDCLCHYYLM